jgi:hypothetical protein
MEHIEKRLAYVEECRQLYYDADWKPTANRSVRNNALCLYKQDGKNCAAGRLDPNADWTEDVAIDDSNMGHNNNIIAIDAMIERGLHSGNNSESIKWVKRVQLMHDFIGEAKGHYQVLTTITDFTGDEPR